MVLQINGEKKEYDDALTLEALLEKEGYRQERIAVEWNGSILPKAKYAECVLSPNDKLEIVTFVGGG